MKATRRTALTGAGVAALGLAGCTADQPRSPSGSPSPSASDTTATAPPDPDGVAIDRAATITLALVVGLAGADPVIDTGGRLAAIHAAHLAALEEAAGSTFTPPATEPGRPLTPARLRRRELNAQRELARLAQTVESGALARVLASMSAGIAAGLSHRGEVPR